ncbi:MAG TPA: dihydroneopterin aldolase [Verrucomicrobiae bacterium]|jgi:dihydroneopterin aldolase|nr:dihydroneopterin aldolase [Verrucomicrobiae bacterium]
MDRVTIKELVVAWRVGVTDEERALPQKVALNIEMELDFAAAAQGDALEKTVDYFEVRRRLRQWGDAKSWRLIETIAVEVAQLILSEFKPATVAVEVQKFVLPDTTYVSAWVKRP